MLFLKLYPDQVGSKFEIDIRSRPIQTRAFFFVEKKHYNVTEHGYVQPGGPVAQRLQGV